jgi:hypothetical protein
VVGPHVSDAHAVHYYTVPHLSAPPCLPCLNTAIRMRLRRAPTSSPTYGHRVRAAVAQRCPMVRPDPPPSINMWSLSGALFDLLSAATKGALGRRRRSFSRTVFFIQVLPPSAIISEHRRVPFLLSIGSTPHPLLSPNL